MNCNSYIHDEMEELGEIICPFCDSRLNCIEKNPLKYNCCDNPDIIEDKMLVCRSCGVVHGYNNVDEYIYFYKNRHRLKRKSVYHSEYHLNNTILDIEQKYNIEISYHQKHKIDKVFTEIGNILNEVNGIRKRMISINFIIRNVLSMMDLPFEDIPISK